MHRPDAPLATLHKVLCPREEGGLLSRKGVVDFTVSPGVAPGVFVVAEMRHRACERMNDPHLSEGPYYILPSVPSDQPGVPLSAAAAVLFDKVTCDRCRFLRPKSPPAPARSCRRQTPDAIGEYCYRGFALRADALRATHCRRASHKAPPSGLIAKGEFLTTPTAPDGGSRSSGAPGADELIRAASDEPAAPRVKTGGSRHAALSSAAAD
jgi:predicted homoserine dehydrogenase-like protein